MIYIQRQASLYQYKPRQFRYQLAYVNTATNNVSQILERLLPGNHCQPTIACLDKTTLQPQVLMRDCCHQERLKALVSILEGTPRDLVSPRTFIIISYVYAATTAF